MKRCDEERICDVCRTTYQAKVVTARFCSRKCMYMWRKTNNWEDVACIGCGSIFHRRKNEKHYRTGLPRQYCSNKCSLSSSQKKEKLTTWALSENNHWNDPKIQAKIKETKKRLYGDENYNNSPKQVRTAFQKYGTYTIWLGKSQGKRITKPQIKLYEQIKQQHQDAELEKWLPDAQRSVDIYIPSENRIIELYGTYWHADPRKYTADYFNKATKLTAKEMWNRDEKRNSFLKSLGYKIDVVWELDTK
jgi:hypothetical protein